MHVAIYSEEIIDYRLSGCFCSVQSGTHNCCLLTNENGNLTIQAKGHKMT